MAQMYLTDAIVRNSFCPAEKQQEIIWDSPVGVDGKVRHGAMAGLGLRITRNGQKAFLHAFHYNGRRNRSVIGNAAIMSVMEARTLVKKRELDIDAGKNPDAEHVDYRKAHTITVRELIDEYYAGKLVRYSLAHRHSFKALVAPWLDFGLRPKKGGLKRKPQNAFGTKYGDAGVTEITPRIMAGFVNAIPSDHTANAALQHVKAMYNWGLKMQIIDMRNPCDPIELRRTVRRRRHYSQEEIQSLVRHIFQPPLQTVPVVAGETGFARRDAVLAREKVNTSNEQMIELCAYMAILILTMARPNEVKNAEFGHFDLEQLVWHKHNTKGLKLSRKSAEYAYRSVPVHPRVGAIVAAQRQRWPEARFVFPCVRDGERPRDNFQKAFQRFKALPEVPPQFQLYDLKRIAISLMLTARGVSRQVVSHYVDHHGNLETTMIYDLGLVEPLRPVTKRLGDLLGV